MLLFCGGGPGTGSCLVLKILHVPLHASDNILQIQVTKLKVQLLEVAPSRHKQQLGDWGDRKSVV